jgi:hypothetical protein
MINALQPVWAAESGSLTADLARSHVVELSETIGICIGSLKFCHKSLQSIFDPFLRSPPLIVRALMVSVTSSPPRHIRRQLPMVVLLLHIIAGFEG